MLKGELFSEVFNFSAAGSKLGGLMGLELIFHWPLSIGKLSLPGPDRQLGPKDPSIVFHPYLRDQFLYSFVHEKKRNAFV